MTNILQRLAQLGQQLEDARDKVADLEEQLSEAKEVVNRLEGSTIPDLMTQAEVQDFTLGNGAKLKLDTKVSAVGGVKSAKLHAWLRKVNQAGLIKSVVEVPFKAGTDDEARALVKRLQGDKLEASFLQTVHAASLQSAVKKMLLDGVDVPDDVVSIFPRVKFTPPKS